MIKGEELEAYKNHLIAGFQIEILIQYLKEIGKIVPEEECTTNFLDDQYSLAQIQEIISEIKKHVTHADRFEEVSNRSIKETSTLYGRSSKITGKTLLMFILLSWLPMADAKWYEFSATIEETSVYDTMSTVCTVVSFTAKAAMYINPAFMPVLLPVVGATATCSVATTSAGTLHRTYNSYTEKHPAEAADLLWREVKAVNPILPDSTIKTVISTAASTEGGMRIHNLIQNKGKSYFSKNLWRFRFFPKEEVET
jgi:hypothetical protein